MISRKRVSSGERPVDHLLEPCSGRAPARSTTVRAGVVTGISLTAMTSTGGTFLLSWTVAPGSRTPYPLGTVISTTSSPRGIPSRQAAISRWRQVSDEPATGTHPGGGAPTARIPGGNRWHRLVIPRDRASSLEKTL
jgi:hypothetical protein